jgi:hypothetical protein
MTLRLVAMRTHYVQLLRRTIPVVRAMHSEAAIANFNQK